LDLNQFSKITHGVALFSPLGKKVENVELNFLPLSASNFSPKIAFQSEIIYPLEMGPDPARAYF